MAVDLSQALTPELLTIPGVGEARARYIIEERHKGLPLTMLGLVNATGLSAETFRQLIEKGSIIDFTGAGAKPQPDQVDPQTGLPTTPVNQQGSRHSRSSKGSGTSSTHSSARCLHLQQELAKREQELDKRGQELDKANKSNRQLENALRIQGEENARQIEIARQAEREITQKQLAESGSRRSQLENALRIQGEENARRIEIARQADREVIQKQLAEHAIQSTEETQTTDAAVHLLQEAENKVATLGARVHSLTEGAQASDGAQPAAAKGSTLTEGVQLQQEYSDQHGQYGRSRRRHQTFDVTMQAQSTPLQDYGHHNLRELDLNQGLPPLESLHIDTEFQDHGSEQWVHQYPHGIYRADQLPPEKQPAEENAEKQPQQQYTVPPHSQRLATVPEYERDQHTGQQSLPGAAGETDARDREVQRQHTLVNTMPYPDNGIYVNKARQTPMLQTEAAMPIPRSPSISDGQFQFQSEGGDTNPPGDSQHKSGFRVCQLPPTRHQQELYQPPAATVYQPPPPTQRVSQSTQHRTTGHTTDTLRPDRPSTVTSTKTSSGAVEQSRPVTKPASQQRRGDSRSPSRSPSSSSDSDPDHSPDHHRDRHRRRRQRRHSRSHSRRRSPRRRSPQMPKMPVYSGKGNWEAFIFQFQRICNRCDWRPSEKKEKLLDCLSEQALDYAQKRQCTGNYDTLRDGLEQRFINKDTASVARKLLHNAKQKEDEGLEDYSQRVHFWAIDGHPDAGETTIQQMAVEAFLIGCRDKRAAAVVMEREPKTIYEAQVMVKANINNHKALFGKEGSRSLSQRKVSFPEDDEYAVRQAAVAQPQATQKAGVADADWQRMQKDMNDMKEMMTALMKIAPTLASSSATSFTPRGGSSPLQSPTRRFSGSPRGVCYHCQEPGHYRADCPKRTSPGSSRQSSLNP